MALFPADRLRAVVVQGVASLCAAAALRVVGGSGRLQARQRHQGSVPWSKKAPGLRASVTRPAPSLAVRLGRGAAHRRTSAGRPRIDSDTESVAILAQE